MDVVGAEDVVIVGAESMGAAGVVVELPLPLDVVLELDGRFCEWMLKETWPMLLRFSEPLVKL